jgi:hypothetical protein
VELSVKATMVALIKVLMALVVAGVVQVQWVQAQALPAPGGAGGWFNIFY